MDDLREDHYNVKIPAKKNRPKILKTHNVRTEQCRKILTV